MWANYTTVKPKLGCMWGVGCGLNIVGLIPRPTIL